VNNKQKTDLMNILDKLIDYALELKHCWRWKEGERIASLDNEYNELCSDIERAKTFRVDLDE
jgi:hypothetical protein